MDPSITQEAQTQKSLVASSVKNSSFSSSLSKISGCSRGISCSKNINVYFNFDKFKNPIHETSKKSQLILECIPTDQKLWGKTQMGFLKNDIEYDEVYNWLINSNHEMFKRSDVSLDEIKKSRHKEQRLINLTDDSKFQCVNLKKEKIMEKDLTVTSNCHNMGANSSSVKIVSLDDNTMGTQKPKLSFHMNWIPKPQDEYKILVNNVNQPFQHVWLQTSKDGSRLIHPLEKLSVFDFIKKSLSNTVPLKPPPIETTPFKLVQDVKDLKELVAKLAGVDEFAVDLEHNQYRSFQGLTCLMQISTRTEDFIVDTLKLHAHIGPYMRKIFKDPTKRKVMHGADNDILWLQRDFGIYVCNMFDTGQASRVLKMERNRLDFLLLYFCGVAANKEYQTADWRLRPLTDEMLRYAREDTHYLLYVYDLMKRRLLSSSTDPNHPHALLADVYQRSYDVCMQLYQKDILTQDSYLNIYGVAEADLNGQQLSIVAALCEWRDIVARIEDESTGYVLPNKTLIEIAKKMPVTNEDLSGMLMAGHPLMERNIPCIVTIIRNSKYNAAEYEIVAKKLKEEYLEMKMFEEDCLSTGNQIEKKNGGVLSEINGNYQTGGSSAHNSSNWNTMNKSGFMNAKPLQIWGENHPVQKDTSCGFRAVPGNAAGNRKLDLHTKPSPSLIKKPLQLLTSNGMITMKQKEGGSKGSLEVVPSIGYAAARKEVSSKGDAGIADPEEVCRRLQHWLGKRSKAFPGNQSNAGKVTRL